MHAACTNLLGVLADALPLVFQGVPTVTMLFTSVFVQIIVLAIAVAREKEGMAVGASAAAVVCILWFSHVLKDLHLCWRADPQTRLVAAAPKCLSISAPLESNSAPACAFGPVDRASMILRLAQVAPGIECLWLCVVLRLRFGQWDSASMPCLRSAVYGSGSNLATTHFRAVPAVCSPHSTSQPAEVAVNSGVEMGWVLVRHSIRNSSAPYSVPRPSLHPVLNGKTT
jgi:hypothetical protein